MGEKLVSPPLIEALCEFRFTSSETWDWTIPGRLYEQIGNEFSERAQVDSVTVQMQVGPGKPPLQQIVKGPERVQLKRPDGSAMVQVGPHLLVINQLRPYSSWEDFRSMILKLLEGYIRLNQQFNLARIGLRYINQIELPETEYDLGKLITVDPPLKGSLNRPLAGFFQRYELIHNEPDGILVHQSGIQQTDRGDVLVVDLDFGSQNVAALSDISSIERWLNEAHDRVYESFVDSLVPALYEFLKEGDDGSHIFNAYRAS